MAETTTGNVFDPDVWGDVVQAEFVGKARVLNSGATVSNDTLQGQPGSTVHFPKWNALGSSNNGELEELTEASEMQTETMGQTDSTATVKEYGKAVEITDSADLYGIGDPGAEARRQFSIMAARTLDGALIAAAEGNAGLTAEYANTGITWADGIVNGIEAFGDEFEPDEFGGLFVRSTQQAGLFRDPQFIDASKFGADSPARTGQIGTVAGVPVFVTDRLTDDSVLLMKSNVLGALYKRRPLVENDRDILKRTNVVTTNVHFAVKALAPNGICKLTRATAA